MSALAKLPNVGKVLEQNLIQIGVETADQLRKLGSKKVFALIRQQADPGACLHMLYGIEGAVQGIPDKFLSAETKEDLKIYYNLLDRS